MHALDPATPGLGRYVDLDPGGRVDAEAVDLLEGFKGMLPAALDGLDCITAYSPLRWASAKCGSDGAAGGIDPGDAEHGRYLRGLLDDCCRALLDSLDRVQDALAVEPDPLVDECAAHLRFAYDFRAGFVSTSSGVAAAAQLEAYLDAPGGEALVLHGRSGSGKTSIMALAVDREIDRRRGSVAVRFLGTTPAASAARSLVYSLSEQLHRVSVLTSEPGGDSAGACAALPPPPPHANFEGVCAYLWSALAGWRWGRLSLFLDSLDQLEDTDGGRRLDWLPLRGLSPLVHLIVSTLPDEAAPPVGSPFRCLSILTERLYDRAEGSASAADEVPEDVAPGDGRHLPCGRQFVKVEPLSGGEELLPHLLRFRGRCVTQEQMTAALAAIEQSESTRTPLFSALLADQMARWRSFDPIPSMPTTVRGAIVEFFQRAELNCGERLVRAAVGFITLARKVHTRSHV